MNNEYRFIRTAKLSDAVGRIEPGRTTRTQVLEYLGPPDLEIDGTAKRIDPSSPIARVQERMDRQMDRLNSAAWLENQPYSSIKDDHLAFLYLEIDGRWKQKMTPPIVPLVLIMVVRATDTVRRNKLLLLIDKHTGIVDQIAYSEEFEVN